MAFYNTALTNSVPLTFNINLHYILSDDASILNWNKGNIHNTYGTMLVTKQNQLDDWFEIAANNPVIRRWLSPKALLIPPILGKDSWDAMHFLIGEALVTLAFDRSRLEAKVAMYNSGTIADGATALNEAFVIGYKSGPWRALRSACCVTNERSLKLNKKAFGEPWGISTKSAWDAGLGEWVDEAHFRRMRDSVNI